MRDRDGDAEKAAATVAAAFRTLPVKARNRVLFDLLKEAGATGIVIPGENGEIEGYLADRTVALKYLKNKSWTIETVRLMQAVFAAQGAGSWIDLGANIGTTVVPAALAGATCHAVEADPANLALLLRNLARNDVDDRVTVHDAAVWDTAATLEFERAPANLGDHRVRTRTPGEDSAYGEGARHTVSVPARPVDDLIDARELSGPVLVKLDIQGAEGHALSGGSRLFDRADVALLEYWPYGLRRLGTTPEGLLRQIERYFSHAALIADDQRPEALELRPLKDIIETLVKAESENRTAALDLVLCRSGKPIW